MKLKIFIIMFLLSFSFINVVEVKELRANNVEVTTDEMVNKVINMIEALPNECTLKDEDAVKKCRVAYDNLLPSQKVEVTNLLKLLEKENQIALLYSEISYVVSLIDTLPSVEEFELTHEKKLNEIISKYNELDNLQKELVSNYSKVVELSNKLNNIYTSIDKVITLIDTLPNVDNIDISIYSLIDNIEIIYNSLTNIQKEKITNINKYLEIKEVVNRINIIVESINNIPSVLTLDYLKVLENIQSEYLKLTVSQKTLITNYESFLSLYNSILDALEFNDLILELIDYINLDNKYLLDYLLNKYLEYNDNQKVFITNYEKLLLTQDKIKQEEVYFEAAKEVMNLINELPIIITLDSVEKVKEVRTKYDMLHDNSKKYVDNLYLLLEAEAKIIKLQNEEYASSLEEIYKDIDNIINDINNVKDDVNEDKKEIETLLEEVKTFIEETKANEAKGFNKYIIIAIGAVSVFIIVAIIYIFSINQKKIRLEEERI